MKGSQRSSYNLLVRLALVAVVSVSSLAARAQAPILLNIWTYASTPTMVSNYQAVGVAGLAGNEPISQYYQPARQSLVSPMVFTNGGQVLYLNDTAGGGTWAKNTGAGPNNGLMDCYLYLTNSTVKTMTVSNLNLVPGTNYTLYLVGTIPVSDAAEDGRFQPVNTPNITFASTTSARGIVAFPFTTSASYSNGNTLQFTWAKASSGNGSFQGLAIVPGSPPAPVQTLTITNGVQKCAVLTNTTVNMSGRCELWVTSSLAALSGCVINLNSTDAWLFLPNVKPSIMAATIYLGQVRINNAAAVADSNCRVVEYGQTGAVVIPQASNFQPLTVFDQAQFAGTATSYSQWTYYTGSGLGGFSSFKLKRGYQVVLAQSADGKSWSRCYTAQDGDLEVGALPATLDRQVQFICVTPWRWASKKGSCDIAPADLSAQWWYNWNINANSTRDMEYVAIHQQPYWPSLSQNWQARGVNHVSGYNEPNNSTQDAYKNLNPPGSVSDAVARFPDQLATGLRVGAPAVDDGGYSWIVDFVNRADAAGYRLDYVPVHYYRSYPNNNYPAGAAGNLYSFLKSIHDAVKRPIWLTEFNNGANWTSDPDPTFDQNKNVIEAMINMMDGTPWIERYSIYSAVEEVRQVYYNAGGYTPMGLMYRDHLAPLASVQAIPDNGMRGIAQYLFRTNTCDSSGYYNNGMAVGAPVYATGHNSQSQAIVLDGADGYVQLPANVAKGSAFTFAAWVYWNGGGNWQRIFDFGNDTTQYLFLTPSSGSGTLRFAINSGSGEQTLERAGRLASGLWQHVAVTLSGSNATLYVNGAQVAASTGFSIAPSSFNPQWNFLGKSQWPDPLFNGKLDDVEIADYAMTSAEIAALYNNSLNPTLTSGVWTNSGGGNWGTANNWSGGLIANGPGRIADFSTINLPADRTVTLESARTNGGLRFGDTSGTQNWILAGGNTLTLDGGGVNAAMVAVNQNTATISTPLAGGYGFVKTGGGTLVLNGVNKFGGGLTVSAGSVNITGGSTAFGNGISTVGYLTGSGTLIMTGGSLAFGGELRVGGSDQSGTKYVLAGTASLANATMTVGSLTVARGNYLDNSVSGTLTLNGGSTLICSNDAILEYAGKGLGKFLINGGTFLIGPAAAKWFMIGYWDSGAGQLDITSGKLLLENGSSLKMCRGNNNTGTNVVNQLGGAVTFYSDGGLTAGGGGNLDLSYAGGTNSTCIYNLNGGILTVPRIISSSTSGTRLFNFNGGSLKAAGDNAAFMGSGTASTANVRNLGAIVDTTNFSITIGQALLHSTIAGDSSMDGGLTKRGSGTLTLTGAHTYRGATTISDGTLALSGSGSIANSYSIHVSAGAIFDVSGSSYTLGASQTLKGDGTVNGAATINGTVSPGASSIGTLTFATPPVLNGTTVMELNRTNAQTSDRLVASSGTLAYGGTLTVANLGPDVQAGDSFLLFSAGKYSGAFSAMSLPPISADLGWSFNLSSGLLRVVSAVPPGLRSALSTNTLTLSWPTDHTGWRLQIQTNGLTQGLGTNWLDVPGAMATNSMNFPVDPNNPSVFYRLVYP